jgi:hypothetical protein
LLPFQHDQLLLLINTIRKQPLNKGFRHKPLWCRKKDSSSPVQKARKNPIERFKSGRLIVDVTEQEDLRVKIRREAIPIKQAALDIKVVVELSRFLHHFHCVRDIITADD